MNWDVVQRSVVLVPRVPWQRWVLMGLAVILAAAASICAMFAAGHASWAAFVLVVALSLAAAAWPDSHAATVVAAVVVWQWLATTDDMTTAWTVAVALCLFMLHVVVTLMAVTPVWAPIAGSIVLRWAKRCGWVVIATIGMWALVFGMAERRARGNAALTAAGFVVLAALVVLARQDEHSDRPHSG